MSDHTPNTFVDLEVNNKKALQSIDEVAKAVTGPLQDAVESAVGHLGDAFVEFARTGELSVRDMVDSIIASLARIAFNSFIKDPLTDILSNLGEGFGSLLTSALTGTFAGERALGGSVSFGRPYVVWEQGRELFVPESSGRIVPNNMLGGGGIIFNVQATDASSFRRSESQIAAMLHRVASRGQRNL